MPTSTAPSTPPPPRTKAVVTHARRPRGPGARRGPGAPGSTQKMSSGIRPAASTSSVNPIVQSARRDSRNATTT